MTSLVHHSPISSVAVHGSRWATGGYDNRILLWQESRPGMQAIGHGTHDHLVNHVEFSPDGAWLVSASSDGTARIWRLPDLRLTAVLADHDDDVDMACFSPDGERIATCALDRAVRVFDRQGRCLQTFRGHQGNILAVAWRPDGQHLVSCGVDGTVREWSLPLGQQVACHTLGVRTDTLVMDVDGRILAGDDEGRIALLDGERTQFTQAHRAGIKKLVYCPQRQVVATLSYDREIAIWQRRPDGALHELRRTLQPAVIWARAAAVLPDGRLLVGTFGSRPAIYDWVHDGWTSDPLGADSGLNAVACHRGHVYAVGDAGLVTADGHASGAMGSLCNFLASAGAYLYTGGQLGQVFDAASGTVLHQHHSPLNCAVALVHQSRPHLAVGTYTGEILIFEQAADGRLSLHTTLAVHANAVKGLCVQSGRLFSVCANTAVAWHDLDTLALIGLRERMHDKIANACCPAGPGLVASVARDRYLRLWAADGDLTAPAQAYLSPHQHSIKSLSVSADQRWLATGSYGGTVAWFDLTRRAWTRFEHVSTAGIAALAFDPARSTFLAAAYDGELHVLS